MYLPESPARPASLGHAMLGAGSKAGCTLMVHAPETLRQHAFQIAVRQTFEGQEMGRITWRLAPKEKRGGA